jgi:hypothetical protein
MATETVYTTGKSSTNARINIGSGAISTEDGQIAFPDECSSIKLVGTGSHSDGNGTILIIDSNGIIKKAGGSKTTISDVIAPATSTTLGTIYGSTQGGGNTNITIGFDSAPNIGGGAQFTTAMGYGSMINTAASACWHDSAFGADAMSGYVTGTYNSAFGSDAGSVLTDGNNNTFVGGNSNTTAATSNDRIALGYGAIAKIDNEFAIAPAVTQWRSEGLTSAADGAGALLAIDSNGVIRKTGGTKNTAAALSAPATTTTLGMTYASVQTTSTNNNYSAAFGYSIAPIFTAAGQDSNTIIGSRIGANSTTTATSGNTIVGTNALNNYANGSSNTAVGAFAGASCYNGTSNVFLGFGADTFGEFSGSVALGASSSILASNELALAPNITQIRANGLSNIAPAGHSKMMYDTTNKIMRPMSGCDVWCAHVGSDYAQTINSGTSGAFISGLVAQYGSSASWLTSGSTITIPSGFPTNGLWEITVHCYASQSGSITTMSLDIYRSGANIATFENAYSTAGWSGRGGSRILQFSPAQTIQMRLGWNASSASSVSVKANNTYICLKFLGSAPL